MPESIPAPPENGVSKKSLDGAEYYKKEYIEGSEEVKFPPMINPETGEYFKTEPMYRETHIKKNQQSWLCKIKQFFLTIEKVAEKKYVLTESNIFRIDYEFKLDF